jgi:hypothetical protein
VAVRCAAVTEQCKYKHNRWFYKAVELLVVLSFNLLLLLPLPHWCHCCSCAEGLQERELRKAAGWLPLPRGDRAATALQHWVMQLNMQQTARCTAHQPFMFMQPSYTAASPPHHSHSCCS